MFKHPESVATLHYNVLSRSEPQLSSHGWGLTDFVPCNFMSEGHRLLYVPPSYLIKAAPNHDLILAAPPSRHRGECPECGFNPHLMPGPVTKYIGSPKAEILDAHCIMQCSGQGATWATSEQHRRQTSLIGLRRVEGVRQIEQIAFSASLRRAQLSWNIVKYTDCYAAHTRIQLEGVTSHQEETLDSRE